MSLSEEQRAAIEAMTEEGDIYGRLASSIAPEARGNAACSRLHLPCPPVWRRSCRSAASAAPAPQQEQQQPQQHLAAVSAGARACHVSCA